MVLSHLELEEKELQYLEKIEEICRQNLDFILERLRSRFPLFSDWYNIFRSTARRGYSATDLDKGAEKVFGYILSKLDWKPVAIPIGSDFTYETEDAIIHIDIKTALESNPSDYKGVIDIGENQTSFNPTISTFQPHLPTYYYKNTKKEKPCLTYIILIVHIDAHTVISNNIDQNPVLILLISIPNGELSNYYGTNVVRRGKQKKGHFRYKFISDSIFRVIQSQKNIIKKRIRIIYQNPNLLSERIKKLLNHL